jgi:hypothetical protein
MGDQGRGDGAARPRDAFLDESPQVKYMAEEIKIGDRVQIYLNSEIWGSEGWFEGSVVRIDPYSQHRSFYWVQLDTDAAEILGKGIKLISVLNPKNIRKA